MFINPRHRDERNFRDMREIEKGAQTHKATGHPEPIDADEQLLYCCWMRGASQLPPNWWEEVRLVV